MAEIRFLTANWKEGGLAIFLPDIDCLKSMEWFERGKILKYVDHENDVRQYRVLPEWEIDEQNNIVFHIELIPGYPLSKVVMEQVKDKDGVTVTFIPMPQFGETKSS